MRTNAGAARRNAQVSGEDPPAHLLGGAMGVLNAHNVSSLSNLLRRRKHQVRTFRVPERLCRRNFRVRALFLDENSVF